MSERHASQIATAAIVAPPVAIAAAEGRHVPPDFRAMYIELGLEASAEHYRAHHTTVRRWRDETPGVVAERKASLAAIRLAARQRAQQSKRVKAKIANAEKRRRLACAAEPLPDPEVLRGAAHYLRFPQNGGHRVSPSGHGDWFIGCVRVTPQDLVRRAVVRGFDVASIRPC